MKKLTLVLFSIALFASACSDRLDSHAQLSGEVATKTEYSILQGVELQERGRPHAGVPLIRTHALSSAYDAIGLPLKTSDRGYAWVLAKSDTLPEVKVLPEDALFAITQDQIAVIARQVHLSKEVQDYLNSRAVK